MQLKKAEKVMVKEKRVREDLVFKERRKRGQNLIFSTSVNHCNLWKLNVHFKHLFSINQ